MENVHNRVIKLEVKHNDSNKNSNKNYSRVVRVIENADVSANSMRRSESGNSKGGVCSSVNENTDGNDKMYEALRLPQSKTLSVAGPGKRGSVYGGYERLYGNDKKIDGNGGTQANVGSRSLSYYNYRNNKSCNSSVSHNNKCNEPKDTKCFSFSSRLLTARVDYNRSVAGSNHDLSSSVGYVKTSDGINSANISYSYNREEVNDDEWDDLDNFNYYNDGSFSKVACSNFNDLQSDSITIDKLVSGKVNTDKSQLKRDGDDKDIKDITHKIQDVCLDNDMKKFWSDFYKNRQAKRMVGKNNTKDIGNDLNNNGDNAKDNYNTFSKLKNAQFDLKDKNYVGVRLDRDSIRPPVFNTKDRIDDSSIKENTGHKMHSHDHNSDVNIDHGDTLDGKHCRQVHASVNITDNVVKVEKDINLEELRHNSEISSNENLVRDSTEVIKVEENNVNVSRKPNIITKLTAYYRSKNREVHETILNEHKYDDSPFKDIPTKTDSDNYFYNNTQDYNMECNDVLNRANTIITKDKENYCNTKKPAVDCELENASHCKPNYNDSYSSKAILQENNTIIKENAHSSVKNALLLRRLHIYEKINSKTK